MQCFPTSLEVPYETFERIGKGCDLGFSLPLPSGGSCIALTSRHSERILEAEQFSRLFHTDCESKEPQRICEVIFQVY